MDEVSWAGSSSQQDSRINNTRISAFSEIYVPLQHARVTYSVTGTKTSLSTPRRPPHSSCLFDTPSYWTHAFLTTFFFGLISSWLFTPPMAAFPFSPDVLRDDPQWKLVRPIRRRINIPWRPQTHPSNQTEEISIAQFLYLTPSLFPNPATILNHRNSNSNTFNTNVTHTPLPQTKSQWITAGTPPYFPPPSS